MIKALQIRRKAYSILAANAKAIKALAKHIELRSHCIPCKTVLLISISAAPLNADTGHTSAFHLQQFLTKQFHIKRAVVTYSITTPQYTTSNRFAFRLDGESFYYQILGSTNVFSDSPPGIFKGIYNGHPWKITGTNFLYWTTPSIAQQHWRTDKRQLAFHLNSLLSAGMTGLVPQTFSFNETNFTASLHTAPDVTAQIQGITSLHESGELQTITYQQLSRSLANITYHITIAWTNISGSQFPKRIDYRILDGTNTFANTTYTISDFLPFQPNESASTFLDPMKFALTNAWQFRIITNSDLLILNSAGEFEDFMDRTNIANATVHVAESSDHVRIMIQALIFLSVTAPLTCLVILIYRRNKPIKK